MRVLLVGAGAVGQVYGRHLQAAGWDVAFYVKPKYLEDARRGFVRYPARGGRPERFEGYGLITAPEEVAAERWDQVWLCVSSPALAGGWLPPLLAAAPGATVVMLQPGLHDRRRLLELVPEERLVSGMIGIVAWQAPLPGELLDPPGIRCWFPPLSPSRFSGPPAVVDAVVGALRRGGCPARRDADATRTSALGSAVLLCFVAGLEVAGWDPAAFRRGDAPEAAAAAAREALAVAGLYHGASPGLLPLLARGWAFRLALRAATAVAPFDLPLYLRYHFEKVGDQTREALRAWEAEGRSRGLDGSALRGLAGALPSGS